SVGSTILGTVALNGSGSSATAGMTISGSAAGLNSSSNTITAVYNGDGTHNAATTVTTLTVVAAGPLAIANTTNSASFPPVYAPGMWLSIFGSGLSLTTKTATTAPLPLSLDNVSVTVNGVSAPVLYVSNTQLNVQIPYETSTQGAALVTVSNNGQSNSTFIQM